jgi:hypothetical protein
MSSELSTPHAAGDNRRMKRILVRAKTTETKHERYAVGMAQGEKVAFEWCPGVSAGEAPELSGYSHCPFCGVELAPLNGDPPIDTPTPSR